MATTKIATANGADPVQQQVAADANTVQDGCNLVAIVGAFHTSWHFIEAAPTGTTSTTTPSPWRS